MVCISAKLAQIVSEKRGETRCVAATAADVGHRRWHPALALCRLRLNSPRRHATSSPSSVIPRVPIVGAAVLAGAIERCIPGAVVSELCAWGNAEIEKACGACFKGKDVEKGVAFPLCISSDGAVGHVSPPEGDTTTLAEGSTVKCDVGCHIGGHIVQAAATCQVGAKPAALIGGIGADAAACAACCYEVFLRLARPGKPTAAVAPALAAVAAAYGCVLVEGVLSHQVKRFLIDGDKVVLSVPGPDAQEPSGQEFAAGEAWCLDVLVSKAPAGSSEAAAGKTRVLDERETQVFKRDAAVERGLKSPTARKVLAEIERRFPLTPFSLRSLASVTPGEARLALTEMLKHNLVRPYPVLREACRSAVVAQCKGTVILNTNGTDRLTATPRMPTEVKLSAELVEASGEGGPRAKLDDNLKALLAESVSAKKRRNKKK